MSESQTLFEDLGPWYPLLYLTRKVSYVYYSPTAKCILESNIYLSFSSAFPHNGQNIGLSPFLGTLNTGGSLPDLTNLHYSTPLPASLDTGDHVFGSMSVGHSVGNLPAAMTHLGLRSSSGKYPPLSKDRAVSSGCLILGGLGPGGLLVNCWMRVTASELEMITSLFL